MKGRYGRSMRGTLLTGTIFLALIEQVDGLHAQRRGQMEKRHDRRITPPPLKVADILLRETRNLGETLLRESLLTPQLGKVQSNEAAHIHTRHAGRYILSGLSLIRCICPIQRPSCHAAFMFWTPQSLESFEHFECIR